MELIINRCYGGYSVSPKAMRLYAKRTGLGRDYAILDFKKLRTDPELIAIVKELEEEADGSVANLKVVEIPDDVEYYIDDYDGMESVHEVHRIWQ